MIPFFDRNFGTRVPRAIRLVGRDIRYHDEEFAAQDTPDTDIIPNVARNGWVMLTRDKKIRRRPAEVAAIRMARAKCVVLAQRSALNAWGLLHRVVCSWEDIETIVDRSSGPFILNVYKDGRLRKVDL